MSKKLSAILRAFGALGAVLALVGGVTFAALNSTATLTQSTIASASADLQIWNGTAFASTAPGFTVTGLVPGAGSAELPLYLKNAGGVGLNVSAHVPALPSSTGFTGWQNLKVTISSTEPGCGATTVVTNMLALSNGDVALPCNDLKVGAQGNSAVPATEGNYTVKFDVDPAAVSGSQVTVGAFDVVFTGAQL